MAMTLHTCQGLVRCEFGHKPNTNLEADFEKFTMCQPLCFNEVDETSCKIYINILWLSTPCKCHRKKIFIIHVRLLVGPVPLHFFLNHVHRQEHAYYSFSLLFFFLSPKIDFIVQTHPLCPVIMIPLALLMKKWKKLRMKRRTTWW